MDRRWHIPFLGALVTFFSSSVYRLSGLLFVNIMEEFNVNREEASWPVSMIPTGYDMGGLVYGLLSQRLSLVQTAIVGAFLTSLGLIASVLISKIWWMTVTLGLLHGLGSGTMSVCVQVFVSQNFAVYRGIAHGIVNTGPSISAFVFPILMYLLTSRYTFEGSLFLLGGILLNLIPLSTLLGEHFTTPQKNPPLIDGCDRPITFSDKLRRQETQYGTQKNRSSTSESKPRVLKTAGEVLRAPVFYVLFVSWLAMYLNLDIILTTVVDFATDIGAPERKAAALLSLFSIMDGTGRLLIPLIADKNLVRRSTLWAFDFLVVGILVATLSSVRSYKSLVIVMFPMAAAMGCSQSMFGVLLADYIGLDRLSVAYGLCSMIGAPILLLKPLVIGYFRDTTGSYVDMFCILAGLQIMSSCLWFGVLLAERKNYTVALGE
ncbi:monocarboxylate transporter 12-B [Ixodes scapularis]|uniref:monocarboxylate transporter 12-B n=1 Tax=Ixodes scapularis TaxID=6945 RepID=UPI001C389712|nr:monocarboxylate transporter 12-B [Ixodes scapularis]